MLIARGQGLEEMRNCLMDMQFQFCKMNKFWELLHNKFTGENALPDFTLRNVYDSAFYILYIYH